MSIGSSFLYPEEDDMSYMDDAQLISQNYQDIDAELDNEFAATMGMKNAEDKELTPNVDIHKKYSFTTEKTRVEYNFYYTSDTSEFCVSIRIPLGEVVVHQNYIINPKTLKVRMHSGESVGKDGIYRLMYTLNENILPYNTDAAAYADHYIMPVLNKAFNKSENYT